MNNRTTWQANFSAFLFLLVAISLAFMSQANVPKRSATPSYPGKKIRVNNIGTHIHCSGSGGPTVILESGLGGNSLEWSPVQDLLSSRVRVCSYDRPGYGWSDLSESPRNALTISRELDALLEHSGETAPYILVGHSFGGHIVRLYANAFGNKVAGLVLVDASHEALFDILGRGNSTMLVTPRTPARFRPTVPSNLPPALHPVFKRLSRQPHTHTTIQNETFLFRRSAAEVRRHTQLPAVPVAVISRGANKKTRHKKSAEVASLWSDMQKDLHQRLSNEPHVVAEKSGHFPHLDQPQLVADTILELIHQFKTKG